MRRRSNSDTEREAAATDRAKHKKHLLQMTSAGVKKKQQKEEMIRLAKIAAGKVEKSRLKAEKAAQQAARVGTATARSAVARRTPHPAQSSPVLACQHVDWKHGGHQQACKPLMCERLREEEAMAAISRAVERSLAACAMFQPPPTDPAAGGCDGGGAMADECAICLDSDGPPYPIQGGCGCRGAVGLAHIACRVEEATHQLETIGPEVWHTCQLCKQYFTGAMAIRLAEAQMNHAGSGDERAILDACHNVCAFIYRYQHCETAETILKDVVAGFRWLLGDEHEVTLASVSQLAACSFGQSRYAEAESLFKQLLPKLKRVFGESDPQTLAVSGDLAVALGCQGHFAEAEAMLVTVHAVQKRTLGDSHEDTMLSFQNMARAIFEQGRIAEAEIMLKKGVLTTTRVFGKDHPSTQDAVFALQTVRKAKEKAQQAQLPQIV